MCLIYTEMKLSAKKIQILNVAEELFSQQGFDGTSVRAIAKIAEVNIAMISYYFGSKEKLLGELINRRMSGFGDKLNEIANGSGTFAERLNTLTATILKQAHTNRRIHKILHFEFSHGNRKIKFDNFINQKTETFAAISAFIDAGQKEGVFSKDVNIKLIVPTILGTYFHYIFNKRFYERVLGLGEGKTLDQFVYNELTQHIQQTIYALLQIKD